VLAGLLLPRNPRASKTWPARFAASASSRLAPRAAAALTQLPRRQRRSGAGCPGSDRRSRCPLGPWPVASHRDRYEVHSPQRLLFKIHFADRMPDSANGCW